MTGETAEEADLEVEETDQDQDQDPEIEIDHQEDTGMTPENIEEDTTGIETIAEIEIGIGVETVIDREITTAEIEEGQDLEDLAQSPIHVLQLHQDDRGDTEAEIQHPPKSLKVLEGTTGDERGTHLLIEMKRTAHKTKIKRKKHQIQKERRVKQELTVTKLITCLKKSRKKTRLTKLIEEIGEAERIRIYMK